MPPSVRQFARDLRQRLRRGGSTNDSVTLHTRSDADMDPELPYLAGSSASRVSLSDVPTSTPESLFFSRLPPEIRHQILVEAFGGRTLHMDIRLSPPMLPMSERSPITTFDAAKYMPHGGLGADVDRFSIWPKEVLKAAVEARVITPISHFGGGVSHWQWWSCVCHRGYSPKVFGVKPLSEDDCLHGTNTFCQFYAGEAPDKCLIGCTGWLTACRRAYMEGIQVLYGTNTIFLSRAKLIDAILKSTDASSGIPPAIVPTAHLARITRLEITWDLPLATRPIHDDKQAAARATLVETLSHLARADAFPRLAKLTLSYGDSLYQRPEPPEKCMDDLDKGLLNPLREMSAAFWKNRQAKAVKVKPKKDGSRGQDAPTLHLTVELPTNTFTPMWERAVRSGDVYETGASYFDRRFWCVSSVKVDEDGMPLEEEEGEQSEENTDKHRTVDCGFWVKTGIESRLNFDYQGNPYRLGEVSTLH